jgi:hypothetical protein
MATTPSLDATDAPPDAARIAAVAGGIIGVALTIGALAMFGGRTALSVSGGAVIAVANLLTMSAIVRGILPPAPEEADDPADAEEKDIEPDHAARGKRGGAAWGAFALVKMLVLFGGIWILLTRGLVDPIPLAIGYGVLPLGIAVSGIFTSLAPRSRGRSRRPRTK